VILRCSFHHDPPEDGDGLYELWDGRMCCMACLVEMCDEAERAELSDRLGFVEDPKTRWDILRRLYGPKP